MGASEAKGREVGGSAGGASLAPINKNREHDEHGLYPDIDHVWPTYGLYMIIYEHVWAIPGHIWPMYDHIWIIYGHTWSIYSHIWSIYGHIWAIYGPYMSIYGHI